MKNDDLEAQNEEITALCSIYGDDFRIRDDEKGGFHRINVALQKEFHLVVNKPNQSQLDGGNSKPQKINIRHLPPVHFHFQLPSEYPTACPPTYSMQCVWLTSGQVRDLQSIWLEGDGCVVLFSWFDFLVNELVEYLQLTDGIDLDALAADKAKDSGVSHGPADIAEARASLLLTLIDHDETERCREFNSSAYECAICFVYKSGLDCVQLKPCQHVCCKSCLRGYFEVQISNGSVRSLNCPERGCESTATSQQIQQLVSAKLFARYERLLLHYGLDSMPDIVYCPRVSCQSPVLPDTTDHLGYCCACDYAFCTTCRHAFHGVAKCPKDRTGGKQDKVLLVSENGQESADGAVNNDQDEYESDMEYYEGTDGATYLFISKEVRKCPMCRARAMKDGGCNVFHCWRCTQPYCWVCLEPLTQGSPYAHFAGPDATCKLHT